MTDGEARQILTKYSRLLIKLANRASLRTRYCTSSHDFDDYLAVAKLACVDAVRSFDPSHGAPEQVWVARLVRQALQKEVHAAKTQGFRRLENEQPVFVPIDHLLAEEPPDAHVQWFRSAPERILTRNEWKILKAILAGETGEDIGSLFGVSKQRIDQIKDQIVVKLKRSARLTFSLA